MTTENKLEEKYRQFQALQQQIEQISEHLEFLHQQTRELDISKNALEEISNTTLETEVLAPIANGIFVKGILKNNQKLIVNVGSNVVVEQTVPETIALLAGQQKEIREQLQEAEAILQQLHLQAMKIYQELERQVQ